MLIHWTNTNTAIPLHRNSWLSARKITDTGIRFMILTFPSVRTTAKQERAQKTSLDLDNFLTKCCKHRCTAFVSATAAVREKGNAKIAGPIR